MDDERRSPDVAVLDALRATDPPSSTAVVARQLSVEPEAARTRLERLETDGTVRSDSHEGETIWWIADDVDELLEESTQRMRDRLDREFRR